MGAKILPTTKDCRGQFSQMKGLVWFKSMFRPHLLGDRKRLSRDSFSHLEESRIVVSPLRRHDVAESTAGAPVLGAELSKLTSVA